MNKNGEILLHSLIIGILLFLVFEFIIKLNSQSSQSGAIIIACLSCIYLITVNEFNC